MYPVLPGSGRLEWTPFIVKALGNRMLQLGGVTVVKLPWLLCVQLDSSVSLSVSGQSCRGLSVPALAEAATASRGEIQRPPCALLQRSACAACRW